MARKRVHRSNDAGLLLLAALGSLCVFALLAWIASHPLILLLPVAGIAALIWWKVHKSSQKRAAERAWRDKVLSSRIEDCDWMTGTEFEQRIALTLEVLGAQVEQAGGGRRDGGADVVARRDDGTRIVIQCKRWDGLVGWDAVKEAHTARDLLGTHRAAVATNTYLSPYAMRRAEELGVEVWDRDHLVELFSRAAAKPSDPRPPDRLKVRRPPTLAEDLTAEVAQPQLSPDGQWRWTGTEWAPVAPAQANRQASETTSESESDLLRRALEVEATYGSDALTLSELRLLQDRKPRRRHEHGG